MLYPLVFPFKKEVEGESGFPLIVGQLPPTIHLKDNKNINIVILLFNFFF